MDDPFDSLRIFCLAKTGSGRRLADDPTAFQGRRVHVGARTSKTLRASVGFFPRMAMPKTAAAHLFSLVHWRVNVDEFV